jgi:hypothetical protein
MSEKQIVELEEKLKNAQKEFGDLTLGETHALVNAAAHSLETAVVNRGYNSGKERSKFLLELARLMRNMTEDELGPQPGFSRRKIVPKPWLEKQ